MGSAARDRRAAPRRCRCAAMNAKPHSSASARAMLCSSATFGWTRADPTSGWPLLALLRRRAARAAPRATTPRRTRISPRYVLLRHHSMRSTLYAPRDRLDATCESLAGGLAARRAPDPEPRRPRRRRGRRRRCARRRRRRRGGAPAAACRRRGRAAPRRARTLGSSIGSLGRVLRGPSGLRLLLEALLLLDSARIRLPDVLDQPVGAR